MSNEFDLEKARAGEPVEYCGSAEWEMCKVFGKSESPGNLLVVERITRNSFRLAYAKPDDLRMAPRALRYRNYLCSYADSDVFVSSLNDNKSSCTPEQVEKFPEFIEWIHKDWQEAEIPSESSESA